MSTKKKPFDDELDPDSTLNRLDDSFDELGLDDSDDFNLDSLADGDDDLLGTENPKDFLADLEFGEENNDDDLNSMLSELEGDSSSLSDFDDELIELEQVAESDPMEDALATSADDLSFGDQDELEQEDDTGLDALANPDEETSQRDLLEDVEQAASMNAEDTLAKLEDDELSEMDELDSMMDDGADDLAALDAGMEEVVLETPAEAPEFAEVEELEAAAILDSQPNEDELLDQLDADSPDAIAEDIVRSSQHEMDVPSELTEDSELKEDAFQSMDGFDDEGEQLAANDLTDGTEEYDEELREISDDELVDTLDQVAFTEVGEDDIPDSQLTQTVASEDRLQEVDGVGDDMYTGDDDVEEEVYSSGFAEDTADPDEPLESLDAVGHIGTDDDYPDAEEIPEADESQQPSHLSSAALGNDGWRDSSADETAVVARSAEDMLADQMEPDDNLPYEEVPDFVNSGDTPRTTPMTGSSVSSGTQPPAVTPQGGGSGLGLAILGVLVAIGGAGGFWYTTRIGADVNLLKEDVASLRGLVGSGGQGGGASREDVETLRDNLFALEKRMEKPVGDLRNDLDRRLNRTDNRVTELETRTSGLDERLASLSDGRPATTSGGIPVPTMAANDQTPRINQLDERISELEGVLEKVRGEIRTSSSPKETQKLGEQLLTLTSQVNGLKQKMSEMEMRSSQLVVMPATENDPHPIIETKSVTPDETSESSTTDMAVIETSEQAATPETPEPSEAPETSVADSSETVAEEPASETTTESASEAPEEPSETAAMSSVGDGPWGLNLRSYATAEQAEKGRSELKAKGLETVIRAAEVSGKTWHRLRLEGFETAVEARNFVTERLAGLGFEGAWPSKNP